MTDREFHAIEPALGGTYYGGFFTESDSTGDIHKFTRGLVAAAAKLGVSCEYGVRVNAIRPLTGGVDLVTARTLHESG